MDDDGQEALQRMRDAVRETIEKDRKSFDCLYADVTKLCVGHDMHHVIGLIAHLLDDFATQGIDHKAIIMLLAYRAGMPTVLQIGEEPNT